MFFLPEALPPAILMAIDSLRVIGGKMLITRRVGPNRRSEGRFNYCPTKKTSSQYRLQGAI